MKIIGDSLKKSNLKLPSSIQKKLDSLTTDPDWLRDMEAQDTVVSALEKKLDNRYLLIRNAQFPELDLPIPLILIGPPGIWLLYPIGRRGYFRAEGDKWEKLGERGGDYRPEKVNLLKRVVELNRVVSTYLNERGFQHVAIEAVLIFTDAGVHVDKNQPLVRIVLIDALERFIIGIAAKEEQMRYEESQALINYLAQDGMIVVEQPPELIKDDFALVDAVKQPPRIPEAPLAYPDDEPVIKAMKKVPFSSRQIVFLGCLVVLNIAVIVGLILVVLTIR